MNIKGCKVLLRAIEHDDADMLMAIINDPETEYMLGGWSFPVSSINQQDWISSLSDEKATLRCIIDVNDNPLGTIILSNIDYKNGTAEIHIKLLQENGRGQGYGTDAVKAMVNYAFSELRIHCIYARLNEHNIISQKLFEKCGFAREGRLRDRYFKRGSYISELSYSIISAEK